MSGFKVFLFVLVVAFLGFYFLGSDKTQGETIKTQGEAINTQGKAINTLGETIKTQGETIKTQGETVSRVAEANARIAEANADYLEAQAENQKAQAGFYVTAVWVVSSLLGIFLLLSIVAIIYTVRAKKPVYVGERGEVYSISTVSEGRVRV